MDTISIVDVTFGIVTTLILGVLTFVEFVSERRRKLADETAAQQRSTFEDTQFALDIQASTSTSEIVALLGKPSRSAHETEFLKQTHGIAKARIDAMNTFGDLSPSLRAGVELSLQRLVDVLSDDPEVQARQSDINERHGTHVRTDRTAYSWNGEGKLTKYELLHLIALRFVAEHSIETRKDFESRFGAVVTGIVGAEVAGKRFSPKTLLDPIAREGRYAARDARLVSQFGALHFDGTDYRAGWALGFSGVPDLGRTIQVPVIEHFRTLPGYVISPV